MIIATRMPARRHAASASAAASGEAGPGSRGGRGARARARSSSAVVDRASACTSRRCATASTRRPSAAIRSTRHRACRRRGSGGGRRRARPSRRGSCRTTTRHPPAPGVEGEPARSEGRRVVGDVEAAVAGQRVDRGLHRVADGPPRPLLAPTIRPVRARQGRRRRQRVARGPGRRRRRGAVGGRNPRRSTITDPRAVQTSTTVISLRVRVPVLSVQMKVVDPSVSTASRRRTRAWLAGHALGADGQGQRHRRQRALRDEGHGDADREEEAVVGGVPMSSDRPKKAMPTPTAITATVRTTRSSSLASGLCGRRTVGSAAAMPASRVVAAGGVDHAPRPRRRRRTMPAHMRSPVSGPTGTLSPVSIDSSTSRPCDVEPARRRPGSGRPPRGRRRRRGTRSGARRGSTGAPSRSTMTRRGSMSPRRSAACSARRSCANAKAPFTRTTTMIASPS